jgi:hypothetical protein
MGLPDDNPSSSFGDHYGFGGHDGLEGLASCWQDLTLSAKKWGAFKFINSPRIPSSLQWTTSDESGHEEPTTQPLVELTESELVVAGIHMLIVNFSGMHVGKQKDFEEIEIGNGHLGEGSYRASTRVLLLSSSYVWRGDDVFRILHVNFNSFGSMVSHVRSKRVTTVEVLIVYSWNHSDVGLTKFNGGI